MANRFQFSQRFLLERKQRNWTQADIAEKLGCDLKTIGRWESGRAFPQPYFRQKICDLFQKTPAEMMLWQGDSQSDEALLPPQCLVTKCVANCYDHPIHIRILDLGLNGAIALLPPISGARDQHKTRRTLHIGIHDGYTLVNEILLEFPPT